jgi:hypothetical protein
MIVFTVMANTPVIENELAASAVAQLRQRLPCTWIVASSGPTRRADAAIEIRSANGTSVTMLVEVKRTFGPRDVPHLMGGPGRAILDVANPAPVLLVAPWISGRTQELLRDEGVNYLDLTGNVRIQLDEPALFVQSEGAGRDPSPVARGKARVQGPKAGRLVRLLVDVSPPYGVRELAGAAGLAPGYVSRLLETLESEALVERGARGRVESVDVVRLLRRWATTYDVFRSNAASRYLARGGASTALAKLRSLPSRVAVTGSFAAVRLAPVAGPALLVAYTEAPEQLAGSLDLIPTDHGTNVVLLSPFDTAVWERTITVDGVTYAAPSQVAVDCLTGSGRMPAEGEAVLEWMPSDPSAWRLPNLGSLPARHADG